MGPLRYAVATVTATATATVSALAACGTGGPLSSEAARDVHERSVRAGVVMNQAPYGSPAVEYARRAVGGGEGASRQIELMAAKGDGRDGHVVLRISSAFKSQGWGSASRATACYRYDLDETGRVTPDETGCPDTAPLTLPPPPFDPSLPPDVLERLDAALRSTYSAAAIRDLAEPGLTASAHLDAGTGVTGVAVQASPGECAMGRRQADGTVDTWHVPPVVAMPGEIGCDPVAAAAGLGGRSPH